MLAVTPQDFDRKSTRRVEATIPVNALQLLLKLACILNKDSDLELTSPAVGATIPAIGKAAAEEAAWAKLQRSAIWWLGENSNAAALEYAGDNEAVKATAAVNAAMQKTCSPGEIIAMQVSASPCSQGFLTTAAACAPCMCAAQLPE